MDFLEIVKSGFKPKEPVLLSGQIENSKRVAYEASNLLAKTENIFSIKLSNENFNDLQVLYDNAKNIDDASVIIINIDDKDPLTYETQVRLIAFIEKNYRSKSNDMNLNNSFILVVKPEKIDLDSALTYRLVCVNIDNDLDNDNLKSR